MRYEVTMVTTRAVKNRVYGLLKPEAVDSS